MGWLRIVVVYVASDGVEWPHADGMMEVSKSERLLERKQ